LAKERRGDGPGAQSAMLEHLIAVEALVAGMKTLT
jgi:hypothetical protein